MIKFIEAKKNYIMALAIFFVIVSLSGTTYSLFIKTDTTNKFDYTTGLLDLAFTEDSPLTLNETFPVVDSVGSSSTPYTLTIKNTGNLTYRFDLKMLTTNNESIIDNKYIKVKVNDNLPHTLFTTNNVIVSNEVIHPGEELTYKINIWLDSSTPNAELGKNFTAKIVSSGTAIYKTLDTSGANTPKTTSNMIPVYYDGSASTWRIADKNNLIETHRWYDYTSSIWANAITVKDSPKQIYDLAGNNNITLDNPTIDNNNLVIEDSPLDIGLSNYNYNQMSTILRVKINEMTNNVSFITNDKINYYYDSSSKSFIFKNGTTIVSSNRYELMPDTWYIIGYTYDSKEVNFYVNGSLLSTSSISGTINSSNTFTIGNLSKITLGDLYIYNIVLSSDSINSNYKTSITPIYDNLLSGYNEFTPMTIKEYYLSHPAGTTIKTNDILAYYVWIPRYKYKLWNSTGTENFAYDALNTGIDIVFEHDKESSGVITCIDNECYSDALHITKITSNDNLKYYTHPAFTSNEELTGFWVSKYELTNNLTSLPNSEVSRNTSLSSFYNSIKTLGDNYHMIKNTEWASIAYLTYSKYGICKNNKCTVMSQNNTFISGSNDKDTTTANIYGVYDMAGSATEFTLSNYTNKLNELSLTNNSFNTLPTSSEYNLYYKDTFLLGDATKELNLDTTNSWLSETNNWLTRGGLANQTNQSIFTYNATTDSSSPYISTRITIK